MDFKTLCKNAFHLMNEEDDDTLYRKVSSIVEGLLNLYSLNEQREIIKEHMAKEYNKNEGVTKMDFLRVVTMNCDLPKKLKDFFN